ncbi:MAG TPA: hypothetical protein VGE21_17175 [Flavobacteriales bacterium]
MERTVDRYQTLKRAAMRLMFAGDVERYMRTLRLLEVLRAREQAQA